MLRGQCRNTADPHCETWSGRVTPAPAVVGAYSLPKRRYNGHQLVVALSFARRCHHKHCVGSIDVCCPEPTCYHSLSHSPIIQRRRGMYVKLRSRDLNAVSACIGRASNGLDMPSLGTNHAEIQRKAADVMQASASPSQTSPARYLNFSCI